MTAVDQLAALAQNTRLEIIKLLAHAGPAGLPAGEISLRLNVLPSTLSFHLAQLAHSGLLSARHQGRSIIYSADFKNMDELLGFLTRIFCDSASECAMLAPDKAVCRHTLNDAKPRSQAQAMPLRPALTGL